MTETIIDAKYYREASAFVTQEQTRYTLYAMQIEPHPDGGAVIVATDGHALAVFHDRHGVCPKPIIVQYRKELLTFLESGDFCIRVNGDIELWKARLMSESEGYALLKVVVKFPNELPSGAEFPDWRKIFPKEPPPLRADFNPTLLTRCGLGRYPGVIIWSAETNDKPAIVQAPGRDDFVGVVMPMKGSEESAYPDYVSALLKPAPAKVEKVKSKQKRAAKGAAASAARSVR